MAVQVLPTKRLKELVERYLQIKNMDPEAEVELEIEGSFTVETGRGIDAAAKAATGVITEAGGSVKFDRSAGAEWTVKLRARSGGGG